MHKHIIIWCLTVRQMSPWKTLRLRCIQSENCLSLVIKWFSGAGTSQRCQDTALRGDKNVIDDFFVLLNSSFFCSHCIHQIITLHSKNCWLIYGNECNGRRSFAIYWLTAAADACKCNRIKTHWLFPYQFQMESFSGWACVRTAKKMTVTLAINSMQYLSQRDRCSDSMHRGGSRGHLLPVNIYVDWIPLFFTRWNSSKENTFCPPSRWPASVSKI